MWPRGTSGSRDTGCARQPYSVSESDATLSARAQRTVRRTSIVDEHRLRDGVVAVVAQGQEHAVGAPRARDLARAAAEHEDRRAAALAPHLELAPAHAEPEAG